jgi:hypothetical protein
MVCCYSEPGVIVELLTRSHDLPGETYAASLACSCEPMALMWCWLEVSHAMYLACWCLHAGMSSGTSRVSPPVITSWACLARTPPARVVST